MNTTTTSRCFRLALTASLVALATPAMAQITLHNPSRKHRYGIALRWLDAPEMNLPMVLSSTERSMGLPPALQWACSTAG